MGEGGWLWIVAAGFLLAGVILAVTTTTSNRWRWAVLAPIVFGTGVLALSVIFGDWGPLAVVAGLFFYAAINYRSLRRAKPEDPSN